MNNQVTITLTQRLVADAQVAVSTTLMLTATERLRSRHRYGTTDGQLVYLQLPRGTVLQDGDLLQSDEGEIVRVVAKPEPVLTVRANTPLDLLKAAYHLGNRHVPLEITATYIRLSPDPVLRHLLEHRGLHITEEIQPFQPESGAYGHSH